jgi:ketosteroid isomerase-like protein
MRRSNPLPGLCRSTRDSCRRWEVGGGGGRCAHSVLGLESVAVPVTLSREDVDYLREGYRLFAEGDPAFLDRWAPDATMVFPEVLPKGGTYAGPWEAMEFWSNTGGLFEGARPEPETFIRDGDRLVVLGHFHGRARATGGQVAIRFAHVFGLPNADGPLSRQRFTCFELIIDTAAMLSAIGEQTAD